MTTNRLRIPLLAALLLTCALSAWACDVPVYQYAVQFWEPDQYQVLVFHRGTLVQEDQAIVDSLAQRAASVETPVNAQVRTIDVEGEMDPRTQALWEHLNPPELPLLVLAYPRSFHPLAPVWSGPLDRSLVDNLFGSPPRRAIAQGILEGQVAVWVLLESDDPDANEAAAQTLEAALAELAEDPSGLFVYSGADPSLGGPPGLQPSSVVHVSRSDPDEQPLVQMLLGTEPDLPGRTEPMAFPVYGRGRVLYALVGAGINPDTIGEALLFLVQSCSCLVKEGNPGVDLLIAADWGEIEDSLPDLATFVAEPSSDATGAPAAEDETPPAVEQAVDEALEGLPKQRIGLGIVIALVVTFGFIVTATVLLARRRSGT